MSLQPPLFAPVSLSVSDVTRYLRELIEADEILQDVWVQGEISTLTKPASGHVYFTLKDQSATLRCVIWKSTALRLRMNLQTGAAIEAHGQIGIYERDGQYQLYVDAVRLAGEGALYQEFLRLKARLEAEGLFDEGRKKPVPATPKRIGLVTSSTGAALQDMLNTIQNRYPLVEVILAPAAVQGEEAPTQIVAGLRALNTLGDVDVILLARGGGSLEDLWCFNDERVVRAVAASQVPVISGIGHETDFTLADFAADLRAPTPTAAAVAATPDRFEMLQSLAERADQISGLSLQAISLRQAHVSELVNRLRRASPVWRIQNNRQRLDQVQERILRIFEHTLALKRVKLNGLENQLRSLDPNAVLQRGFALLRQADGKALKSAAQARVGQSLQANLADGSLDVEVQKINPR